VGACGVLCWHGCGERKDIEWWLWRCRHVAEGGSREPIGGDVGGVECGREAMYCGSIVGSVTPPPPPTHPPPTHTHTHGRTLPVRGEHSRANHHVLTLTAGRSVPLMIDIAIKDPKTGAKLPDGERGEVCIKGPSVMKCYYNKEDKTREAFDDEGYFKSGDIGKMEGGFLYVAVPCALCALFSHVILSCRTPCLTALSTLARWKETSCTSLCPVRSMRIFLASYCLVSHLA
jgi:hypothetical protein